MHLKRHVFKFTALDKTVILELYNLSKHEQVSFHSLLINKDRANSKIVRCSSTDRDV